MTKLQQVLKVLFLLAAAVVCCLLFCLVAELLFWLFAKVTLDVLRSVF